MEGYPRTKTRSLRHTTWYANDPFIRGTPLGTNNGYLGLKLTMLVLFIFENKRRMLTRKNTLKLSPEGGWLGGH